MNNNNNNNNINIPPRNNGNSTTQACAACKYQRRKCAPECLLAPYFPHDRQRQFLNAHKLFGVRNITKIIECLDPHDKDMAMRSIIFQSDMRANDPVGGCFRYIQDLQTQIEYHRAELELVLQHLAIFRAQAHQSVYGTTTTNNNVGVGVEVNINGEDHVLMNADPMALYNSSSSSSAGGGGGGGVVGGNYHYIQHVPPQQHDQYMMLQEGNDSNSNSSSNNNNNNNNTPLQEHVNMWAMQNSLSSLSLQGQNSTNGSVGDEYDHKPMLEMASDERNDLGFEPQQLVHRSDEAVLFKIDDAVIKAESDCMQQAQDHDLKGAATLFTLTNCTS